LGGRLTFFLVIGVVGVIAISISPFFTCCCLKELAFGGSRGEGTLVSLICQSVCLKREKTNRASSADHQSDKPSITKHSARGESVQANKSLLPLLKERAFFFVSGFSIIQQNILNTKAPSVAAFGFRE